MKQTHRVPETNQVEPARRSVIRAISLTAMAVLGGLWLVHVATKPSQLETGAETVAAPKAQTSPKPVRHDLPLVQSRETLETQQSPEVAATVSPPGQPAPLPTLTTEPTALARELLGSLSQLDVRSGNITAEQATAWQETIQLLVQQGPAGAAAIREFLNKNQDISYAGIRGSELLGDTSLRGALFDALHQIGGEAALAVSLEVLQTTAAPSEISLLARYVEQQSPGHYRQEIFGAARESLAMAGAGELSGWDVGPLFQVFQAYGDVGVIADLERALPKWKYYATISMAGMSSGEGIPQLIRLAQDSPSSGRANRSFAWQMLAQVSAFHPEASAALLAAARADSIPGAAWASVAEALAGVQYQIQTDEFDRTRAGFQGAGLKTYHIASGNQNYYSVPQAANWPPDHFEQRLGFINELLAASANPQAVQALQNAQARLAAKNAVALSTR